MYVWERLHVHRDGGLQAVRAAGENLQIRTVYSHFMLIFVVGPIQAANFYAFSAQRMRAARRRSWCE